MLPNDCIIVSEGANTMDTSRSILNHRLPRHRYVHEDFFKQEFF